MKLNINKYYTVFTVSDYIQNTPVKVLGYIGYDRASQYQSMIENVAINEKFINNVGDTLEYLKSQLYYDCAVIENSNGEIKLTGEHIILWDDIIDSEKTQRLNEEYTYKLSFKFKNIGPGDNITKNKVVEVIKNAVKTAYNLSEEKVDIDLIEILDNSLDDITSRLSETEDMLEKANEAIRTFVSLENNAKVINSEFTDNNINTKVNNLGTKLDSIENSVNTIISQFK